MIKFVSSKSKKISLCLLGLFLLAASLTAMFDSEPLIAFAAVMMLSLIVLLPVFLVLSFQISKAKQMMKQQEEAYGLSSILYNEEIEVINSHVGVCEEWIINNAIGAQCILHRHSIQSIHEYEHGLEFLTTLQDKPFKFDLKNKESEKSYILHWYDPLYEIPLEKERIVAVQPSKRKVVLIIAIAVMTITAAGIFMFNGTMVPEPVMQDEMIYFYDYLTSTSKGSVENISYEIVKDREDVLLYVFNEGETYVELELHLYDEQDNVIDTAWSGVVRPGYYTSIYVEGEPELIKAVSAWFYTFDYHVPSFDYEAEYAWREYNTWINVVLPSEQMSLDNIRDLGIREYAIEDLSYTGADCVYIYDESSAQKSLDKITNQQMWDTSTARYRIDYEVYDYRIHIYELDGVKETLIETVAITEERFDDDSMH